MSDSEPSAEWRAVCAEPIDEEILQLEARLRLAQLTADVPTLDALIAEDLLFAGPDGALATKAMDLAGHAFRYTRVWAREDDARWRVVAGHVSAVA
jgi:hypothetical protein